jgi:hypothetical protein
MPDRTMTVGDTSPDFRAQLSDASGVITTLGDAEAIHVYFVGQNFEFDGPGHAIDPPVADPGGKFTWNVGYAFAEDDTSEADIYRIRVVVTLSTGTPDQIETFVLTDKLTVQAPPTIAG